MPGRKIAMPAEPEGEDRMAGTADTEPGRASRVASRLRAAAERLLSFWEHHQPASLSEAAAAAAVPGDELAAAEDVVVVEEWARRAPAGRAAKRPAPGHRVTRRCHARQSPQPQHSLTRPAVHPGAPTGHSQLAADAKDPLPAGTDNLVRATSRSMPGIPAGRLLEAFMHRRPGPG